MAVKLDDGLDEWELQHLQDVEQYENHIAQIYDEATNEVAKAIAVVPNYSSATPFSLSKYPAIETKINKIVDLLASTIQVAIIDGINAQWTLSNNKNNEMCNVVFGSAKSFLSATAQKKYYTTNDGALKAFIDRKEDGMYLSQRVWQSTEFYQEQIELAIDIALRDGVSSAKMSTTLKQYLNDPDRLFRRVKDEHGILHLSKAAKSYNPGQGKYRSSHKNAMRLAATETTMAYRKADYLRWQKFDFVVGFEVRRSNNVYNCPVCEAFKGMYPKDFIFVGWHPWCRCYIVAILKTDEELAIDNERIMNGEEPLKGSVNAVSSVPSSFNQYISDNKERAKGWSSMPYFVRNNPQYVDGFEVDTYSAEERKFTRASRTNDAMAVSLGIFLQSKYPDIPNTEKAAIYHYTQGDVSAYRQLNNQLRKGNLTEFNEAFSELISNGLQKLPITDATVYRTVRLNKTRLREWVDLADQKGSTTFRGFTSTSSERSIVEQFTNRSTPKGNETDVMVVMKSKSGHSIEDFSQFGGRNSELPNQHEVLFNKGLNVACEDLTIEDGRYVFTFQEL